MSLFSNHSDEQYNAIRAEIGFITDLQLEIEAGMDRNGLSQSDLAGLLNVSPARVCQILSDNGANLEARTIAKIARVLGRKAQVRFVEDVCAQESEPVCLSEWVRGSHSEVGKLGRMVVASNENYWTEEFAAVSK